MAFSIRQSPRFSTDQIEQFKKNFMNFMNLYRGHGDKIERPNPSIIDGIPDTADAIQKLSELLGFRFNALRSCL